MHPIAEAIDRNVAEHSGSSFRTHLGASILGRECSRQLWYSFRWAKDTRHKGRILRLFRRGQREEVEIVTWLRNIGAVVYDIDPETRHQYTVTDFGGHFGGSCDGVVSNLERFGLIGTGIIEIKTHGLKSYAELMKARDVSKSKPEHYIQMQLYMHGLGLPWGLYIGINKNDDALYIEEVTYREEIALQHLDRAQQIIDAQQPPPKISESPSWFVCRWCDYREICHYDAAIEKNCRSCVYARPDTAEGGWTCTKFKREIPPSFIHKGCDEWESL